MSDYKIIFVHGYTASSSADWYPTITPMLQKYDVDFVVPDLPGGDHPHVEEWLEEIHKVVSRTDKPLVFVGHSLGTRTVLLYLEKYKQKAKKVFLIAAFSNNITNGSRNDGETYPDFFEHTIDLKKVKPLVEKFIVMHSKDDSSIPYNQGVEISDELDAELVTFTDRDHFSDPENASYIFDVLNKELGIEEDQKKSQK